MDSYKNQINNNLLSEQQNSVLYEPKSNTGTIITVSDNTNIKKSVIAKFPNKTKLLFYGLAVICFIMLLVGGILFYYQTYAVASVISLDINPSIELKINGNKKVLSCKALNGDAFEVLSNMDGGADLKGTKIDIAVNTIIDALAQYNYLNSNSAIQISVKDSNKNRAAQLRQELNNTVNTALNRLNLNVTVEQTQNTNTEENQSSTEPFSDTSENSKNNTEKHTSPHYFHPYYGPYFDPYFHSHYYPHSDEGSNDANSAYNIDEDSAKSIALTNVGLTESQTTDWKTKQDYDDGRPTYEIEFRQDEIEYEYTIDGSNGAILEYKKDRHGNLAELSATADNIDEEAAKSVALGNAGLSQSQVTDMKVQKKHENNRIKYEVKFKYKNTEYKYIIESSNGEIIEYEQDN